MSKFTIIGQKPLSGEIKVNGAKNLALKVLSAALLSTETMVIDNLPIIEDVTQLMEILVKVGVKIKQESKSWQINASCLTSSQLDPILVPKLRSVTLLIGPMVARLGEVRLPHPGGCSIGRRPIDLFIDGFKALGIDFKEEEDNYYFSAKEIKGGVFVFPLPSVTVTEALMMTAVLATGRTTLINAASEPEISALADYLNAQGAKIVGAGTSTIVIDGVNKISAGQMNIIPDRIETGSFISLALATNSEIVISHCNPDHLAVPLAIWRRMGAEFEISHDQIIVKKQPKILSGYNVTTREYPGFPTDLQSPMTVLLTQAQGLSMVFETVFEGRLFFTDLLNRMGANIILCDPHRVIVQGPTKLRGKKVESPDLRAGLAMVIAGLVAEGVTEIDNIYQIDRGYEQLEKRLIALGAEIKRSE